MVVTTRMLEIVIWYYKINSYMLLLRLGQGSKQPQSIIVLSLASCKLIPKHEQWYHLLHVRHCTITLESLCSLLKPRQNIQFLKTIASHFQERRGLIWLKLFPWPVSGNQRTCRGFLLPPSKQHGGFSTVLQNAAPSRTQLKCWCIGTFKNPTVRCL